jgi:hypothetical protein
LKPVAVIVPQPDPLRQETQRAQEQWQKQGIKNYRYTLGVVCYCSLMSVAPVKVEVRNGRTTSITPINLLPVEISFAAADFELWGSVDKIFGRINSAIDRKVEHINVTYDERLVYPTLVDIDPNIPDAGVHLTITEFEIHE